MISILLDRASNSAARVLPANPHDPVKMIFMRGWTVYTQ
jgi:hypothetical protein